MDYKDSTGALIMRIGFWGPLYYTYYNREPLGLSFHNALL